MHWAYRFDERAFKELKKLGPSAQKDIITYLEKHIAGAVDPRRFGKKLTGNLVGLWRYRVSDYRILCKIKNDVLIVLVVAVGHRKNVYE